MTTLLAVLVQAAAPVQDASFGVHMVQAAVAGILALQIWIVRTVNETRALAQKFNQWAFGPTGDNGVNSKIIAWDALSMDRAVQLSRIESHLENTDRIAVELARRLSLLEGDPPAHLHTRATDR